MVIKAFKEGLRRAWGSKRMIFILLLANLGFALILTMPIYYALIQSTAHSVDARRLLDQYDWNWFTDFTLVYGGLLRGLSGLFLGLVLLYILVNTFFAGGIISVLAGKTPFTTRDFFSQAGKYFPRMLRLMILSLIFYFALDRLCNGVIADWITRLTQDRPTENTAFYLHLLRQVLYVFLFFFINMIFDYAKIDVVVQRSSFVLVSLIGMFFFVRRYLAKTLGLYYMLAAAQGVVLVIFSGLDTLISRRSTLSLVLGVVLSQMLLFTRMGFRVASWAGELALYSEIVPAPAPYQPEGPPVTEPLVSSPSPPVVAPIQNPEGLVQIIPPPRTPS